MSKVPKVSKPRSFCTIEGCDKSFSRPTDLVRHQKSAHYDIKEQCPYCDHRTGQKSNLENHIRALHTGKTLLCPDCPFESASTSGLHAHKVKMHNHEPGTRNRESDEAESVNFGSSSQLVAPAQNTMVPQAPQSQHQGGVSQENFKPFITPNSPPVDLNDVDIPPDLLLDLYNTGTVPATASGPVHSDMKPYNTPNTYYPPTMPSPTIMGPATGTIFREYEDPIHGDDVGVPDRVFPYIDFEAMEAPYADMMREGLAKYRRLSEEEIRACVKEILPDHLFPEPGLEERTEPKYVDFVDELFSLQT